MKRVIRVGLLAAVVALIGCAAPRQYYQPAAPPSASAKQPVIHAGYVPVVFINPSPGLRRHIFLFEGNDRVELIPDGRTGGWMFNRRSLMEFFIEPASGSNWHEEVWDSFSRNSTFTVYDQAERFWGSPVGQPNIFSFSTGPNPTSTMYYRQSPTRPRITCGAVVQLPYVDPSGPSQLQLHYEWNPGAVIKEFLFRGGR